MRHLFKTLAREPVVHFLLAGLMLYGGSLWHERRTDPHRIVIDRQVVEMLGVRFAGQFGTAPTPAQLEELVRQHIRDEVLYREGLTAGLGDGDEVIRRRIIQKMGFLIESETPEPDQEALAGYFRAHADRWRSPPRLTFTQVYFSPDNGGSSLARSRAQAALARLAVGQAVPGDPFPGQRTYVLVGPEDIARAFGHGELADRIAGLPRGQWAGPLQSGLGWHVVRIEDRQAAELPAFATVIDRVRADWLADAQKRASTAALDRLMRDYQVVRQVPGGSAR